MKLQFSRWFILYESYSIIILVTGTGLCRGWSGPGSPPHPEAGHGGGGLLGGGGGGGGAPGQGGSLNFTTPCIVSPPGRSGEGLAGGAGSGWPLLHPLPAADGGAEAGIYRYHDVSDHY